MISDKPDNKERILSFLIFVPAYFHVMLAFENGFYEDGKKWLTAILLVLFTAAYIAASEWLFPDVKPSHESRFWMCCMLLITVGILFPLFHFPWGRWHDDTVFPNWQKYLSLHAFAIYWLLVRSGRLTEGKSGHMLPLDALNGAVLIPFGNLFLRIRIMASTVFTRKENKTDTDDAADGKDTETAVSDETGRKSSQLSARTVSWIAGICAAVVGLILFSSALRQLSSADDSFRRFIDNLTGWFDDFQFEGKYIAYGFAALPVSAYLFGLLAGIRRTDPAKIRHQGTAFLEGVSKAARVKSAIWGIIIALFSVFYLIFFFMQAEYLFGAFIGRLPDGFIVSEYARQGFFELLRVMAVNMVLYWFALRTSESSGKGSAAARFLEAMQILLILESMLFAVVACSKLILYISVFGFTVKRLQSTWLVLAAFGLVLALLINRLTGRRTAKTWILTCGISWSLLCLL
jgi:ABC-type multidrug transport system fused ATPase/permease subunit